MSSRSRSIVVVTTLVVAMATGGWLLQGGVRGGLTALRGPSSGRAVTGDGPTLLREVIDHVQHDFVDSLSDSAIYQRSIEGMLLELHDPHSVFLTADRLSRLDESTEGMYAGIGLQVDLRDGWPTVVSPLAGSPAERAGLRTGDRIVEIDGRSTFGWTGDEAAKATRGRPGTIVEVLVERPGWEARVPYHLPRQEIQIHSVQRAVLLRPRIGYIAVNVFAERTSDEVRHALDSLTAAGMKAVVLDLRGNPGGLLDAAVAVSDLFLNEGQDIVRMRGRTPDGNADYRDRSASPYSSLPVVLLVNQGTASASEIVAGALQDHDRALIVGHTTYGKGSAQNLYRLADGGALKLTTARWFTPSGRSIGRPLVSDDDPADAPSPRKPPTYRTDSGRVVNGGGGIAPDLPVQDPPLPPAAIAFQRALGASTPRFRDALANLALAFRARHIPSSPDFPVQPMMRDSLWTRMRARGVTVDRGLFDADSAGVDRAIALEVDRYVFGPDAEFRRAAREDRALQEALDLADAAKSPSHLLALGTRRGAMLAPGRLDSTTIGVP